MRSARDVCKPFATRCLGGCARLRCLNYRGVWDALQGPAFIAIRPHVDPLGAPFSLDAHCDKTANRVSWYQGVVDGEHRAEPGVYWEVFHNMSTRG